MTDFFSRIFALPSDDEDSGSILQVNLGKKLATGKSITTNHQGGVVALWKDPDRYHRRPQARRQRKNILPIANRIVMAVQRSIERDNVEMMNLPVQNHVAAKVKRVHQPHPVK